MKSNALQKKCSWMGILLRRKNPFSALELTPTNHELHLASKHMRTILFLVLVSSILIAECTAIEHHIKRGDKKIKFSMKLSFLMTIFPLLNTFPPL